jgi:hypothetical protein
MGIELGTGLSNNGTQGALEVGNSDHYASNLCKIFVFCVAMGAPFELQICQKRKKT